MSAFQAALAEPVDSGQRRPWVAHVALENRIVCTTLAFRILFNELRFLVVTISPVQDDVTISVCYKNSKHLLVVTADWPIFSIF